MAQSQLTSTRKKRIKKLLSQMNKQNLRFIPVTRPLVEMVDMTTSDEELEYLLQMGTGHYDYDQACKASGMSDEEFQTFFDTMKRKGLVHIEYDGSGKESYRLNAVAVGWYECMMHYLRGKPQEKAFSEKWNEYFFSFKKLNFFPLRGISNLILPAMVTANQDTGLLNPEIPGKTKRMTIPIGAPVKVPETKVYPTFYVNEIIEEFGAKNAIYAFPCVCRHGNNLIDSACKFKMPEESCIVLGGIASAWAKWGYGRHVTKEEALDILREVRDRGAVHSVIHERDDHSLPEAAICNCCWDCCGILKSYNMGAIGLKYRAFYTARIKDDAKCTGCGNCEKFCPTTAMRLKDKKVSLDDAKCIGCGQCAFQCRQNNIELFVNNRTVYLPVLKKSRIRVDF